METITEAETIVATCLPLTTPDTSAPVLRAGQTLGLVHCINTARAAAPIQLRYFGRNSAGTATGQAHPTQVQAVADVVAWADGQEVYYEKHGLRTVPVARG